VTPNAWIRCALLFAPLVAVLVLNRRVGRLLYSRARPLWALPPGRRLAAAAAQGELATVRKLLAQGLPVDGKEENGATALMRAAAEGRREIVALLLDHGASLRARDEEGWTALMYAA
jgi:ankyrin repeat protein